MSTFKGFILDKMSLLRKGIDLITRKKKAFKGWMNAPEAEDCLAYLCVFCRWNNLNGNLPRDQLYRYEGRRDVIYFLLNMERRTAHQIKNLNEMITQLEEDVLYEQRALDTK